MRIPVTIRLAADEIDLVDRAASLRGETRAAYLQRITTRDARSDLRRADRVETSAA